MLIDLHVHTDRYSTCGRSSPEEMIIRAAQVGLDALVFTEHNLIWPEAEVAELQARFPGVRLYRGTELTSADGDDYLVYGVTDPSMIEPNMAAADILRLVHTAGATVILAHPYRYRETVPPEITAHPAIGIEIMSTNIYNYAHHQAVALARRLGAVATAASDGHHVDMLGLYAMVTDVLPADERALARLIRADTMQMTADCARIEAQNAVLEREIPHIRAFMAQGLSDRELRERLDTYVNLTVIESIRLGRDVLRPSSSPCPVPSGR
jgi:histidinol phosphatase-like PHP family hydrolase